MKNRNQKLLAMLISSSLLFSVPSTTYAMDLGTIFSVSTGQQIYGELGKALGAIFFKKEYKGNLMDNISAILKTEEKKNVKNACIKNMSTCSDPSGLLTQEDWTEIYTRNNINPNNPFGYGNGQYAQNGQYGNNQQINNFPYPNQQNTQQTQPIQNGQFPTLNTQSQQTTGSSVIPQIPAGNPYSPEGQKQIQAAQQTQPTQIAGATTSAGLQYKLTPSKTCFTKVKPVLSPKAPLVGDEVDITLSTSGCDAQKAVLVVGDNKVAVTPNAPFLAEKEATEGTKQANFMVKDAKGNIIKGTFAYTVGAVGAVGSADEDETTYGGVDSTVSPTPVQNEDYQQRFNQSVADLGGDDASGGNYDDGSYSSLSDASVDSTSENNSAEDNAYFENAIPAKNYPALDNTDKQTAASNRFWAERNAVKEKAEKSKNNSVANQDSVTDSSSPSQKEEGFFSSIFSGRKKEEDRLKNQFLNSDYNNKTPGMQKMNEEAENARIATSRVISDTLVAAGTGCATGALATSWSGPGALAGCAGGATISGIATGLTTAGIELYSGNSFGAFRSEYIENNILSKEGALAAGLGLIGGAAGAIWKAGKSLATNVNVAKKAYDGAVNAERAAISATADLAEDSMERVGSRALSAVETQEKSEALEIAEHELANFTESNPVQYVAENVVENIKSIPGRIADTASSAWETFKSWF